MSEALKLKPHIEINLVILKGPHVGQRFSFSKKEIAIGRSPENDIVLLNDPLISRHHAKVVVVGTDIEIINLSQKNTILVNGESVQQWKLTNSGSFVVGDTEFQIEFDLGQSVVPIQIQTHLQVAPSIVHRPSPNVSEIKSLQMQNRQVQRSNSQPPVQQQYQHQSFQQQQQTLSARFSGAQNQLKSSKTPFYAFAIALTVIAMYFYTSKNSDLNKKTSDKKTLIKYSDEVLIKLNSKTEKENQKKIENLLLVKNSPTAQRAQENFIKGMRDFQLGNYSRAQEFFQVVLNLQPGDELAKRHLYLSKVRFDEVLKAKLMLGESYYQKHNFKMCQSLYEQVLNMLQGKSSDQNFQLATAMVKKCSLASEGIR